MNNNPDTSSISNEPLEQPGMDFNLLRQEGIRHLQRLASKIWTDHNTHDPGITILDQLCYALTDLSYRIDYDIKDLLAEKDGNAYKSLYSPSQIMTTNPVTLLDFRKVVIDVDGVKNAWIEKVMQPEPAIYMEPGRQALSLTNPDDTAVPVMIKGLYNVLIEKKENYGNDIQPDVKKRLMSSRNVCEDFLPVKVLGSQPVAVAGSIEAGDVEDLNLFVAGLLAQLAGFISPTISFYSLEEMLEKGKRIDEIVDGPWLKHGFIDDEELIRFSRKLELHTSDIIHEIMTIPGVIAVKDISLISAGDTAEWRLVLDNQKTPKLDFETSLNNLVFTKNGLSLQVHAESVRTRYNQLMAIYTERIIPLRDRDIIPEAGTFRDIETYYSIQNQFPQAYGIGKVGLPDSVTDKRRSQANQLKAYLLFYDQLLANYFSQVAHLKDAFSFSEKTPVTYFSQQLLEAVPDATELLAFKDAEDYTKWLNANTEEKSVGLERKNRYLNHLLARFSENFTHYSLLVYDSSNKGQKDTDPLEQLILDKQNFLKNYPTVSAGRYKAFDYSQPHWSAENRSGLETRIATKLGIFQRAKEKITAENNIEDFYMLEHILLRPVKEDYNGYIDFLVSKRITAIDPGTDANYIKCTSAGHGLQNGEAIVINGTKTAKSPVYDGTYSVEKVLPDSFELKAAYIPTITNDMIASGKTNPSWIRERVDTTFLVLTQPITKCAKSSTAGNTKCTAPAHGLHDGEIIEINGTQNYDGKYAVTVNDPDTFDIIATFVANETSGRWVSVSQKKDPFSLQLTFIFPDWPDRFKKENSNFRSFIEKTIREETPVHLTVYVRWLSFADMQRFENAYTAFLDRLSNN